METTKTTTYKTTPNYNHNAPAITIALVIATAMVIYATEPNPYGYYQLLRLFLCGLSLFLLLGAKLTLADWQRWMLGGFAVLYNPILPIALGDKAIWTVVNFATIVLLWIIAKKR